MGEGSEQRKSWVETIEREVTMEAIYITHLACMLHQKRERKRERERERERESQQKFTIDHSKES